MPPLTPPGRAWATTACIAIVVPTLIAYNLPPSATFLNQAAAVVGWGIFLFVLTASDVAPRARVARLQGVLAAGPLLAALALVGLAAVAAGGRRRCGARVPGGGGREQPRHDGYGKLPFTPCQPFLSLTHVKSELAGSSHLPRSRLFATG